MWIGRLAVLLFLVVVPGVLSPLFEIGGHDLSRIAQVTVSTVCAMALAGSMAVGRRGKTWDRRVALVTGALFLLALASTLHAPSGVAAMRELALALGLAGIAAVVAASAAKRQMDVLGVTVVVAAAVYSALTLLTVSIAVANAGALELTSVILGYDNYRLFNHAQTVVLPLLVIACGRSIQNGRASRMAWFALAMNVALLLFTRGRATMVAVTGATLLSLLLFQRAAFEYVRHVLISVGLGGLVYLGLFVGLPLFTGSEAQPPGGLGEAGSVHARFMLWREALGYIVQAPWLGIGPMHYAHHMRPDAAHPHNIYLQLASEWGVPMMLGLVALSAWAAWRMARAIKACTNPQQATVGIGLFTAMIAIALDGMFSGNFVMPVAQVWIATAIGWAVAWTHANTAAHARQGQMHVTWHWGAGLAAMLVASQTWLCWSISPEAFNMSDHLDHVRRDISTNGWPSPRFWSNGWF